MPVDPPPDRASAAVTAPINRAHGAPGGPVDGWSYQLPRWDAYFAIIGVLGLVLAWTTGPSRPAQLAATGLLLALAGSRCSGWSAED